MHPEDSGSWRQLAVDQSKVGTVGTGLPSGGARLESEE